MMLLGLALRLSQAQIITLLKRLCREHGAAVMLVTHDMGVIAETADRVAVMYAGRIAEVGPVREVIKNAKHPYTAGLMGSIPKVGRTAARLAQIDGAMPRLNAIPPGCAFNPRCTKVFGRCRVEPPEPTFHRGKLRTKAANIGDIAYDRLRFTARISDQAHGFMGLGLENVLDDDRCAARG